MKRFLKSTTALLLIAASPAWAGGQFTGQLPPQSAYGPLQGTETLAVDTNLAGGAQPQTVSVSTAALFLPDFNNKLIGGDFTTNPAQRFLNQPATPPLTNITPTAAVITADRWWVISPAGTVDVTIDSTASTATVPALQNSKALRIQRHTGTTGGITCVGQTLDQVAAKPFLGNQAIFSFWESNGATQSATNGNFTVSIDYSSGGGDTTGTQATIGYAGALGSKFALGDAGTAASAPTNWVQAVAGISVGAGGTIIPGSSTTVGGANTIAQFAGSTTWTRYGVYANIPLNVPGTTTPVTNVSVSICYTPTAATAVTTDYIELEGLQLESRPALPAVATGASGTLIGSTSIGPTSNPVATVPYVPQPSPFERRPAVIEAYLSYYYWYYVNENPSLVTPVPFTSCQTYNATTGLICNVAFPTQMRITPAVKFTNGFQAMVTALTSLSALTSLQLYSNTLITVANPNGFVLQATAGANIGGAAGFANMLYSLGTSSATGVISASAEP